MGQQDFFHVGMMTRYAILSTSHPTTRRIIALLLDQECSHDQIKAVVRRSGSTISEHMKKLDSARLILQEEVAKCVSSAFQTSKAKGNGVGKIVVRCKRA